MRIKAELIENKKYKAEIIKSNHSYKLSEWENKRYWFICKVCYRPLDLEERILARWYWNDNWIWIDDKIFNDDLW